MKTEYLKAIPRVKLELAANQNVRERDFWLRQLSGDLVKSNFPFDYKKDNIHEGNMSESAFIFPKETCSRLLRMSKGSDYALNALLLSGLTLLLNKYTHGTDIIIGTPIYKHNRENETGLINTLLPIRTCVEDHLSFKQLLIEVSRTIRQVIDHYNYPLEILAKKLGMLVPGGDFPFFDIVLLLRNIHDKNDIRHISPLLVFDLTRTQESIQGVVKFDSLLYDSSTIKQIISHFTHLLSEVLTHMDLPIAQINILTEKEKKHLLVNFNRTAAGYPCQKTIVELFIEQVERTPQHTAVVFVHHHFSYDELNEKTNRLARLLRNKGIKTNSIVGKLISPSIEMIAAILGILKAGGAYLPLESDFPVNRTASMLDDCQASLILTTTNDIHDVSLETINGLAFLPGKKGIDPQANQGRDILMVDQLIRVSSRQHGENPEHINRPTDLAYVMFTSGSTGLPKGTLTEHRNVIRVIKNTNYINLSPADRILQLSNAAFDGSVFDIFGALLNGAALIIVKKENRANLERLSRMIKKEQITVFFVTTALFNALVDLEISCLSDVSKILFGGERISLEHTRKALAHLGKERIIHVYGPTETTVYASYYFLDAIDKRKSTVPIGQPISHTAIYILDSNTVPVPIGVSGEIHISGTGTARGYLNRPELTLEKFQVINNKLRNKNGGMASCVQPALSDNFPGTKSQVLRVKLYKTGDLARWLPDGKIEFLGRIDHQVKIRGFRIEPAEVEYQLLKHEKIKEAVVIIRENKDREKYLCAYILPFTTGAFETTSITEELSDYLSFSMAPFMIPRYFVLLEEMPLNPSGKVDRRALPEPGTYGPGKKISSPQTLLQKKLLDIWSNVLMIEKSEIGIDSDFFQLGGHSLKATIFISKLHKELNVKIPLEILFKSPTIRQLSQYISGLKANRFIGLAAVEKKEYYPLSSPQKRLYVLKQMELAGIAYNVPQAYELEGEVNRKALENTFRQLIKRHESLRTYFVVVNGEPVQGVHAGINFKIEYYGAKRETQSSGGNNVPGAVWCASTIKNFIRPFDLSKAPLLRVGLIKEAEQKHILVIDIHHIITDGTSMELFIREFMALYSGKQLTPLELQYKDYTKWQNSYRQKEIIKRQEKFWLKQFAGESPLLSLPLDYSRPVMQSFKGDVLSFELPVESTMALNQLALGTGTTLYMVLLAIFNAFLSKLGGQEVIVVGTPIAGRRNADLERIIGMFVNTLAIKNYPSGDKKFIHFLTEVKERTLEAFENQEYQFEDLVEQVSVHRDTSRNPIFDIMFVLQNMEAQASKVHTADISKLKIRTYETQYRMSRFDLTLSCFEAEEKLLFSFEYCTKLFKKDTIQRFVIYFQQILSGILADSSQELSQIVIITSEEKRRILYGFNDAEAPYPGEKSLQCLFAEQAEQTPDNTALVGPKEEVGMPGSREAKKKEGIFVTYKELNKESNRLAWWLIEKGVRPDTIVGIMVERSVEMIVGLLGILKAGAAYMPIDPDYPGERIDYMLTDSCAGFLVTVPGLTEKFEKLSASNCQILMVNETPPTLPMINNYQLTINNLQLEYASLGYVIYTSGTTGKSKGSLIEHRNVVSLMVHENHLFDFGSYDVWTMFHSYCFDFSVWEMYGALLYGGKLVLISKMTARDPQQYLKILKAEQVTILNQTPAAFYQLAQQELDSPGWNLRLKYVIFGGEALTPAKLKSWKEKYPGTKLINMFGITETTVHVTYKEILLNDIKINISNIGGPLSTLKVYIIDRYRKLVPIGVPGELSVSGAGVCRGYLNQPELTAERFVISHWSLLNSSSEKFSNSINNQCPMTKDRSHTHHLPHLPYSPIYRSGDLARWLLDGNIEYLGRIDHQVKIRGYRIEPGEIETCLLEHPAINEALVVVREDSIDNKNLCAYFVSAKKVSIAEIRQYLSKNLPGYMIPPYFVLLESIPLTPNGKVDRKALPQPGNNPGELKTGPYIPPGDKIEKKLTGIWSQVLEIPQDIIGIDHNFFELGGHSLKATIMVSGIHKELNVRIQLSEVFKTPTIRELAKYISRLTRDEYVSIKPMEKKEYYHLSSTQKRLYLLQQMEPDSTAYNMPEFIHLDREPGGDKLKRVFNKLVQQHESLRTSFHMIDDQPVQRVHDEVTIEILNDRSLVNCQGRGEVPLPTEVEKIINNCIYPFDLSRAPLLRVGLIELPHTLVTPGDHPSQEGKQREYILMIDMHHIISDGVSHEIMVRDFMALYRGEVLPPLRIRYKDFARWQNSKIQRESIKEEQTYWLKEFAGEIPVLDLPTDYVRPGVKGFEGKSLEFEISAENTGLLETIAARQGGTLYMVLLAIMNILLSKLSRQEDIIIGSPIAGRPHADLGKIIGMFVNTLALRNYPGGEIPFTQFLKQIKRRTLQAFENQGYPFEELVENVNVNRDTGRNPLFDVMFVLQTSISQGTQPGTRPGTTTGYQYENHSAKFDLTAAAVKVESGLFFSFNYSTQLFKKETIQRFISYFKRIVTSVVEEPGLQLGQIEIITGEEKQQLLYGFNDTNAGYPEDKTIYRLFAEQVERTPDNTAVVGPLAKKYGTYTTYTTHISYRELNEKSHGLAGLLIEKGIKPDNIVGLLVERSLEMIIGIIGILKAGGAYLPISPDYPQERINYMLEDSGARILLTQQEIAAAVFSSSSLTSSSTYQASPANLAYIIYTSGSTGLPKGVLIRHCSLVNRLNWMQKKYPLDTDDTLLQKTTYTFDVSVWEILWWSITGAKLYLLKHGGEKDPATIIETIEKNRVTVIHFVPSMLSVFLEYLHVSGKVASLSCLKQVIASGEALTVSHVRLFYEIFSKANAAKPKLDNLYGPTEATIDVSYYTCLHQKKIEKIPIGKPIDNIQLYVIDQWYQYQPVGIPGELCIAGHGLARGYLNRPALTSEKFINNKKLLRGSRGGNNAFSRKEPPGRRRPPAVREPYKRTYKTGDLARWLPDGNIEFLGRIDNQVKIRGYRVELGEIENQLNRHQDVKESVVIHRGTRGSDCYLCAYIVPETGSTPGQSFTLEQELKEYLSSSLPGYMIPAFFVHLEKIPLTPNGKIDRKQLPEPGIQPGESFIAPANVLEETLVDLWSNVLGIEKKRISVKASFFQLGGHSLKASILAAGIYKKLEVNLPLLEIFRNPTVRKLAGILQEAEKTTFMDMEKVEKKEYYPLSFNQKRIFVLHQLFPGGTAYNLPGTFVINHEVKEEAIIDTLYKIIHRHESLRTCFKIINDEPAQFIIDFIVHELEVPFTFIDLSAMTESEKQEERNRVYLSLATKPFDLDRVPLFRSVLLKYHTSHYELMYNMHHIITDGWSMEILRHEFSLLYEVLRNGENLESQPLTVQYKDFTHWHNKQLKGPGGMKSREYWKKKLEKGIPSFSIPGDFAGKANDYKGAVYSCLLHQEIKEQIEKLAELHQTSVFMVLFTLYLLLLHRFSHQEDIACSIIDAGRQHPSLHNIIGFFVNAVIFNITIDDQEHFSDFLQRVHHEVMMVFQHQWYPLEQVCEYLKIPYPDVPLSFNMLNQQDASRDVEVDLAGLLEHMDAQDVKFELEPYITQYKNVILMHWVYKKNLFQPAFIKYMVEEYIKLVDFFSGNPNQCFKQYQDPGRKAISIKKTCAAASSEYTGNNIVQEFENQVKKTPDIVAVKSGEEAFTYRELNRYANQVARQLESLLAEPSEYAKPANRGARGIHKIIGLLLDPGFDMVAGIIGILKTGRAYVPLSPDYPASRLSHILNHSQACLIICTRENKSLAQRLSLQNSISFLELTRIPGDMQENLQAQNPVRHIPGSTLAYLLYTSGSTGTPRGVMQNHQNILYFIKNWTRHFSLSGKDRLTLLSSFCHDASIPDIFGALLNGATLYPFDIKNREDSMDLAQFLVKERITIWHSVASLFGHFANSLGPGNTFPGLRYVILGGEAVREHDIHRFKDFFPGTVLAMVYGQTESTVNAIWFLRQPGSFSINRPLLGEELEQTRIFVVDEEGRQVKPYETGEIVVASPYISMGYWKDEASTKKSFKKEPNIDKLYYTGDLGRCLPEGAIEFMGRKDWQVKIRGYRIEPGEIESQLLKHPDIQEAVVTARESQTGQTGDRYLCAHLVSSKDFTSTLAQTELREYLSARLPYYMIPGVFLQLEKMPLTPTGKLDRRALPEPRLTGESGGVAPGTDIEQKVAQTWKEVLKLDQVGIMDSFFSIGGNSVNILQVNTRLRREFNLEIPLVKMFEYPTIQALSRYLARLCAPEAVDEPWVKPGNTGGQAADVEEGKQQMPDEQPLQRLEQTLAIIKGK